MTRTIDNPTRLALALVAVLGALSFTPPVASATKCPNEAVRSESRENSTTNQPYDVGLPECRAYEMVSPLEKQAHSAIVPSVGVPSSSNGDAVGYGSEGDFAEPANFRVNLSPLNTYVSRRSGAGWTTVSAFAPANLIAQPFLNGLLSDFTPDLTTGQVECGQPTTENNGSSPSDACAIRIAGGEWLVSGNYTSVNGTERELSTTGYLGASTNLNRVFIQPGVNFLPTDKLEQGSDGIYELEGVGANAGAIRLVNVDNSGNELTNGSLGPLIGDRRQAPSVAGTSYQAISANGETVFFTATPTEGVQTVYARVGHNETVAVSNPTPSECGTCNPTAQAATYQGASADGSKVFFTTNQQLVSTDGDTTSDLYEYNFANPPTQRLVQLSSGGLGDPTPGSGAEVQGVVRNSTDGSVVYFVAQGLLTTLPNSLGQFAENGADNLYGVDTNTGTTKFVAELCSGSHASGAVPDSDCATASSDKPLWSEADNQTRNAQTTSTGEYLVFSTFAHLVPEDANSGKAAYHYDFSNGELTWVSHPAAGFTTGNEGKNATIAALPGAEVGSSLDINDWSRALSANGEYVIFTTAEKLQSDDVDGANDVYLWHDGTVSMISDGQTRAGVDATGFGSSSFASMSSTGSDIFFLTTTQLVGQDTDVLQDMYDARIDGGFPAPKSAPSCTSEEWTCQGKDTEPPAPPKPEGSATRQAGGNLTAPPFKETLEPKSKPKSKPLTDAQKLAAALKLCHKDKSKAKRTKCERTARKRYPPTKRRTTKKS